MNLPYTNTAQTIQLPYPPEKAPEDMTSAEHLAETGSMHALKYHLGSPESTVVKAERYLVMDRRGPGPGHRVPDLLVAFNADPELYERNNGYIVSEQGKPPDFVLEIASPSTRAVDNTVKREFYARLRVREYWRFDQTDSPNLVKLAGDRLTGSAYQPMPVRQLAEGIYQGYSEALNLFLRWEQGRLLWYDPQTNQPIISLAAAEQRRIEAEHRRTQAEQRVMELEAELRRLRET